MTRATRCRSAPSRLPQPWTWCCRVPRPTFSRPSLVALLASPHFRFAPPDDERPIDRLDVAALDAALDDGDHRGDADRLEALADGWIDGTPPIALRPLGRVGGRPRRQGRRRR